MNLSFSSVSFTFYFNCTTIPAESKVENDLFRHRNYLLAENDQTNLSQGFQVENIF